MPIFELEFFVPGTPRPGGSKKAFRHAKTGKVMVIDASDKVKEWKKIVSIYAKKAYQGEPLTCALSFVMCFRFHRPKYHYGAGKNRAKLKESAPDFHIVTPDRTKLIRSTEDALTGIVWKDDCQVVSGAANKTYTSDQFPEGVNIHIRSLEKLWTPCVLL